MTPTRRRKPRGAALLAPLPQLKAGAPPSAPPGLLTTALDDPPSPLRCRHCLRSPAADVRPRLTLGLVIGHDSVEVEGPFCRICGTARTRDITNRTLLLGWWSVLSPFANVRSLLRNRRVLRELQAMPAPPPGPLPRYAQEPLDPGRPVLLRSGTVVLAGVVAVLAFVLLLIPLVNYLGPVQLEGECVHLTADRTSLTVVDGCDRADGRIEEIVTGGRRCEKRPDVEVRLPDYGNNARACVDVARATN